MTNTKRYVLLFIIIPFISFALGCESASNPTSEYPASNHQVASSPPGDNWQFCSQLGTLCTLSGHHEVAFGHGAQFQYTLSHRNTLCSSDTFSDVKHSKNNNCWIRAITDQNIITIEANNPQQQITVMGADMERSQFFLNKATNPQQIADWVHKDIEMAYSRVSYNKKQEVTEGSPNLTYYNGAISSMKMVKNANPNVKFWATLKSDYDGYGTSNNLPSWIYTGGGYNGGQYEPEHLNVDKYARFLADYLKLMSDNQVAIDVLSVVKEWSQVVSPTNEIAVIEEIKRLLTTPNYLGTPTPEFSGPSTWGTKNALNALNTYISNDKVGLFSGISTHSYDGADEATWSTLVETANRVGLSVWHTESALGTGPTHGTELGIAGTIARLSQRAMWYRAGIQGELFFEPWSRGVNRETRSIYFQNNRAGVRMRPYYVMKQFANYAAQGAHYLPIVSSGLQGTEVLSFVRNGQIILWLINPSENHYENVTVQINGKNLSNKLIQRLAWFDDSAIEGQSQVLTTVDNRSFISHLAPKHIVSFVFQIE